MGVPMSARTMGLRGESPVSVSLDSSHAYTALEEQDAGASRAAFSCLSLSLQPAAKALSKVHHIQHVAPGKISKQKYGQSVLRKAAVGSSPRPYCYHGADPAHFKLRSSTYLRSRVKEPSRPAIYEVVAADLYTTHQKHWHIMRRMQLPPVPSTKDMPDGTPLDEANIPPLLILHLMMPMYPATFIPTTDGPNCSFIYYFALPDGFDPATFHTPCALQLLQQLATPHPDPAANLPIRQQVKMIAQVCNPAEWAATGKISRTEQRLLESYNGKPVLMRPCQRFYRGKNYLEIDFDLHKFSYFARKSLEGYIHRLQPVVWEHGVCLEGRKPSELPETLLGAVCAYQWDFTRESDLAFPNPALLANMDTDGAGLASIVCKDTGDEHDTLSSGSAIGQSQAQAAQGMSRSERHMHCQRHLDEDASFTSAQSGFSG